MIFKKKKRMIDVRELQRKGVLIIPKKDIIVPTNEEGFVELGNDSKIKIPKTERDTTSNAEFFGFSNVKTNNTNSFQTETQGYNKREVDTKINELDNKIYKLEQRLEVLERKTGVNQPSFSNGGMIGW